MGALPKRRISKRRKGKRRASIRLKLPNLGACKHCGSKKINHSLCPSCKKY